MQRVNGQRPLATGPARIVKMAECVTTARVIVSARPATEESSVKLVSCRQINEAEIELHDDIMR